MKGDFYIPKLSTPWNIISLGAGVQSSTMALMASHGEITPMPQAAIFADTQAEPAEVYKWLAWLKAALPFPVHVVTKGSLTDVSLLKRERRDKKGFWSKSLIPAFIANANGTKGIMGRACTSDYKIQQIIKRVRKMAGIKRGQTDVTVTQWIGISWDERQRMKVSRERWSQHRWPLIELDMTRQHCLNWMEKKGYPVPPRSACVYCPFHGDSEWRRLKETQPEEFARAVKFERDLQAIKRETDNLNGVPFLHDSLKMLDQVDFSTDEERGQNSLVTGFQLECEGMCGV